MLSMGYLCCWVIVNMHRKSRIFILLTLIAVILRMGDSMDIHGPKLFWEDVLGLWVLTVGFAKARLVCMWGVASYWCCWDGAIVVWMPGVSQAEVTANGAALRPPETRLSCPTLLSSRS